MNDLALTAPRTALEVDRFPASARFVLHLLDRLEHGTLDITFPDGQRACFGRGGPVADIRLADWSVFGATMRSGDIGFAESYIDAHWSTSDLPRLLALFVRNRAAAERVFHGSFLGSLLARCRHLLNRNTRAGSKKNIHAHYDLGNDFYALWLDPSFTYSSALFAAEPHDPHAPAGVAELHAAQQAKYARALSELQLGRGAHVLEIGCGWGGFAACAARAGMRVTGITLSPAQLALASERVGGDGVELRLQDYRDLRGQFDGIVSIEMFEAVGESYWPVWFDTVAHTLKPGARACVQTILIDDALFDRYRQGTDFIQQYIFPGGMLPSPRAFEAQAERAGLRVVARRTFGRHYARTLASWRARFLAQRDAVRALGFDERFLRIWDFYLAYCEAAFAEGSTDVAQYTLVHA
jgi:cyclopropane-fatty-acyl-phospholipid synthase